MELLQFKLDRELKPNSSINLPEVIIAELTKQSIGSGKHITLTDTTGATFDCLVNRIGTGFVFRVLDQIQKT